MPGLFRLIGVEMFGHLTSMGAGDRPSHTKSTVRFAAVHHRQGRRLARRGPARERRGAGSPVLDTVDHALQRRPTRRDCAASRRRHARAARRLDYAHHGRRRGRQAHQDQRLNARRACSQRAYPPGIDQASERRRTAAFNGSPIRRATRTAASSRGRARWTTYPLHWRPRTVPPHDG